MIEPLSSLVEAVALRLAVTTSASSLMLVEGDELDPDLIVTTEKDSVRFPYQFNGDAVPIYYLRIEIEFLRGGESWKSLIDRLCQPQPVVAPQRFFA